MEGLGISYYLGIIATILMTAVPTTIMIVVILTLVYNAGKSVFNFFKDLLNKTIKIYEKFVYLQK